MSIVLDVNVLVSAFVGSPHLPPRTIFNLCLQGELAIVISEDMLAKLDEVLGRPKFSRRISVSERQRYLKNIRAIARDIVTPDSTVRGIAKDAEDDGVLGAAVVGNVDYLVTGDAWLVGIGEYRGVRIITPRDFLDLLGAAEQDAWPTRA